MLITGNFNSILSRIIMKKRIAFISEHASPLAMLGGIDSGGQNVYVTELARQLAKDGYAIDIFTRSDCDRLPRIVQLFPDVRVIHVNAGPQQSIPKEQLFDFMEAFKDDMITFIESEGINYALIHANFWMSAWVGLSLKLRYRIPLVVTFHALGKVRRLHLQEDDKFPQERVTIEENIAREADCIIAECPQDKQDLISMYNANAKRIAVVHCGFNPTEFYPIDKMYARMLLGLQNDEKIILQLGRMVPRKGVDNVIHALKYLKRDFKLRLLVVGGEGNAEQFMASAELKRLQKIVEEEGVSSYVEFVGPKKREELKYYYSAADVFVSTPWYEPFGITPLEAMACGTPVIGSNVGGIKYSVVDGVTGYLVPPKKPVELANKIQRLLKSEGGLMGLQGTDRVNHLFTWRNVSNAIMMIYESLIDPDFIVYRDESQLIAHAFEEAASTFQFSAALLSPAILEAGSVICKGFSKGKKMLICGNGGSAAESQHFAAELVGRFDIERRPALPAIALTADTSTLTAWANDFCFEEVFARQVEALGNKGDILFTISTSGNSENILHAIKKAKELGMICINLLGKKGGEAYRFGDVNIIVPSDSTQRIQEIQLHVIHSICTLIEQRMFSSEGLVRETGELRATTKRLMKNRDERLGYAVLNTNAYYLTKQHHAS
uniref:Phosphoheptose isomerase n=1 Tax=Sphingobacterium sp. (strain 21) TaxID=743722 RepID=F4C7D1_SPHS2